MDSKLCSHDSFIELGHHLLEKYFGVNPNTPQILVRNNEESIYFHNNPNQMNSISSEAIFLDRIGAEFVIYQNTVAGTEITDDFDVLDWFQIHKMKPPMLTRSA